jgi:hypothetical protein
MDYNPFPSKENMRVQSNIKIVQKSMKSVRNVMMSWPGGIPVELNKYGTPAL